MTEAEWFRSVHVDAMLAHEAALADERKLRLFALACCRRIQPLHNDRRLARILDEAERRIDQSSRWQRHSRESLEILAEDAQLKGDAILIRAIGAVRYASCPDGPAIEVARRGSWLAAHVCQVASWPFHGERAWAEERVMQCEVLREILGNPFRPATANPSWLTWNDRTVGRMAREIYQERRYEEMPVLADALEDAGCDNFTLLAHCREPGEHYRGCWALDLCCELALTDTVNPAH